MDHQQNGTAPEAPRIRFGDLPTQVIPASWAEHIFRALCATDKGRKQFGELLAAAALSGGTDVQFGSIARDVINAPR